MIRYKLLQQVFKETDLPRLTDKHAIYSQAAFESGTIKVSLLSSIKPVGHRGVPLTAGAHQLTVRFDDVLTQHTHFGGFDFRKAK